jgi:hypothetical protein
MTEWVPGASDSPDRVDALVHGITALYEGGGPASFAMPKGNLRKGGAIEGLPEPVQGRRPSSKLFGYTPRSALQLSEREMEVGKLLAARSLVRQ